jgi:hypothetical protein
MYPGPYEQVPLTADDRDMLYTIYDFRRRFLFLVFILIGAAIIILYLKGINFHIFRIDYKYLNDSKSPMLDWVLCNFILELVFLVTGLFFVFTRILPFRKDLKSGVKEKIPFEVIKKQYFPLTNQYYLTLNDPRYEYHETDEELYNAISEGDNVYLYRAIYSKYMFEENGRFTIL